MIVRHALLIFVFKLLVLDVTLKSIVIGGVPVPYNEYMNGRNKFHETRVYAEEVATVHTGRSARAVRSTRKGTEEKDSFPLERPSFLDELPIKHPKLNDLLESGAVSKLIYRRKYYRRNQTDVKASETNTALPVANRNALNESSTNSTFSARTDADTKPVEPTAESVTATDQNYSTDNPRADGSGDIHTTVEKEANSLEMPETTERQPFFTRPHYSHEDQTDESSHSDVDTDKEEDPITQREFVGAIVAAVQSGVVVTLLLSVGLLGLLCSKGVISAGPALGQRTVPINPELLVAAAALQKKQAWKPPGNGGNRQKDNTDSAQKQQNRSKAERRRPNAGRSKANGNYATSCVDDKTRKSKPWRKKRKVLQNFHSPWTPQQKRKQFLPENTPGCVPGAGRRKSKKIQLFNFLSHTAKWRARRRQAQRKKMYSTKVMPL